MRVIAGEPGRERAYRVIELLAAGSDRAALDHRRLPGRAAPALPGAAGRGEGRGRRAAAGARLERPSAGPESLPDRLPGLLRSGVRIYEWDGPMLHAKSDRRRRPLGPDRLEQPQSIEPDGELRARRAGRGPRAGRCDGAAVPARHQPEPRGDAPADAGAPEDQREAANRPHPERSRGRHRPISPESAGGEPACRARPRTIASNARRSVFIPAERDLRRPRRGFSSCCPRQTAYCVWGDLRLAGDQCRARSLSEKGRQVKAGRQLPRRSPTVPPPLSKVPARDHAHASARGWSPRKRHPCCPPTRRVGAG